MTMHVTLPKLLKVLGYLAFVSVAGCVFLVFFLSMTGKLNIPRLPKAYIILSGSMEPAIPTGSIVVVTPQDFYGVSDIISFARNGEKKNIVTHRIDAVTESTVIFGDAAYRTKGDANTSADDISVPQADIIGRVTYIIPYAGYAVDFLHKPQGFILFVIVPATIIIYEELRSMGREIRKYLSLHFSRRRDGPRVPHGGGDARILYIIPVVLASGVVMGFSKSYFLDHETSRTNVFGAATVFPSPTASVPPVPASRLVINEVFPNGGNTGSNWKDQWVEVVNRSGEPVSLNGWVIVNGSGASVLPDGITLPAGGYAVICGNQNKLTAPPAAVKVMLGTNKIGSNGLEGAGDSLLLMDGATEADRMSYGTNTSVFSAPPAAPSSGDTSVSRHPDGTDTDSASDWITDSPVTIGAPNS